jgi:hypothetical protein
MFSLIGGTLVIEMRDCANGVLARALRIPPRTSLAARAIKTRATILACSTTGQLLPITVRLIKTIVLQENMIQYGWEGETNFTDPEYYRGVPLCHKFALVSVERKFGITASSGMIQKRQLLSRNPII